MGLFSKIKKAFKPKQLEKLVNPVAFIKGEERRWKRLTGKNDKVQTGPALDLPDTAEEMQIAAVMELDRQRMSAIQSLALSRIRDSVITLSRETGFRERPVEQFSYSPLYIPRDR